MVNGGSFTYYMDKEGAERMSDHERKYRQTPGKISRKCMEFILLKRPELVDEAMKDDPK